MAHHLQPSILLYECGQVGDAVPEDRGRSVLHGAMGAAGSSPMPSVSVYGSVGGAEAARAVLADPAAFPTLGQAGPRPVVPSRNKESVTPSGSVVSPLSALANASSSTVTFATSAVSAVSNTCTPVVTENQSHSTNLASADLPPSKATIPLLAGTEFSAVPSKLTAALPLPAMALVHPVVAAMSSSSPAMHAAAERHPVVGTASSPAIQAAAVSRPVAGAASSSSPAKQPAAVPRPVVGTASSPAIPAAAVSRSVVGTASSSSPAIPAAAERHPVVGAASSSSPGKQTAPTSSRRDPVYVSPSSTVKQTGKFNGLVAGTAPVAGSADAPQNSSAKAEGRRR